MHWTAAAVAAVASCCFAGCLAMHFVKRTTNWSSGTAEKAEKRGRLPAAWIVGVVVMAIGYKTLKTLQVLTALVDGIGISASQAKYISLSYFIATFSLSPVPTKQFPQFCIRLLKMS